MTLGEIQARKTARDRREQAEGMRMDNTLENVTSGRGLPPVVIWGIAVVFSLTVWSIVVVFSLIIFGIVDKTL